MSPRDFKERPERKAPPRNPKKAAGAARWPWFGAGVCVGAVATSALFLYEPGVAPVLGPGKTPARAAVSPGPGATRFEFYTLLPEKEIAIPDTEIDAPAPPPRGVATTATVTAAPAATPPDASAGADTARYMLQVGSFRKLDDADRLKARLAFLGLESSIQTVSIDGAESWHRVRVGPFKGREEVAGARARLRENKLESMVLKLK